MKYTANPVQVEASKIIKVRQCGDGYELTIADDDSEAWVFIATPEMVSRIRPVVGDYWVKQSDGYVYLNPKDVFERKYRPSHGELGLQVAAQGEATRITEIRQKP